MARSGMKCYPARGPREGRGARIDDASGFLRPAEDVVQDVRQGLAAREYADLTPGFGTFHPQDRRAIPAVNDPQPIHLPRTDGNPGFLSAKDLGYTDAEVAAAVRAGISLRPKG